MRNIGRLDDASRAKRFGDVLFARGIANDVRDADAGFAIWVHDDARRDEAVDLLERFRADPDHADFRATAEDGRARRKAEKRKDDAYRQRIRQAQLSMYGADGRGWVTIVVLAAAAIVTLATGFGARGDLVRWIVLTSYPAVAGLPELTSGQVWRLWTPILLHFSVYHLVFNGWMWWSFAQGIEARKGARFFVPFVLVAAVVTNLAEFGWGWMVAPLGVRWVGGLSGVLYALFGYIWTKGRIDPLDELAVDDRTTWILLGWLVLCMTGVMGAIANVAHVSGLVFGVAWAFADVAWFRFRKRR